MKTGTTAGYVSLTLLFVLTLAGCGSKKESVAPTGTSSAPPAGAAASYNNATSPQAQQYQQKIQASGKSPYSR